MIFLILNSYKRQARFCFIKVSIECEINFLLNSSSCNGVLLALSLEGSSLSVEETLSALVQLDLSQNELRSSQGDLVWSTCFCFRITPKKLLEIKWKQFNLGFCLDDDSSRISGWISYFQRKLALKYALLS